MLKLRANEQMRSKTMKFYWNILVNNEISYYFRIKIQHLKKYYYT